MNIKEEVKYSNDDMPASDNLEKFKEKFETRIRKNKAGCWLWQASKDKDGYGQIRVGQKIRRAHRVAYSMYTGELIPVGMDIDHLCYIRACVNPDHLQLVSHDENMKNLRKLNDWEISDVEFQKKETTPELVLKEVLEILERSHVEVPNQRKYDMQALTVPAWRDLYIERGHIPNDKYSRVKLFLDCIRFGVNWRAAAEQVLGVSPLTVNHWKNQNSLFADDFSIAILAGKKTRYQILEDLHLDELERKLSDAEFKEVANSLKMLREQDEDRIIRKRGESESSGPNITIVFGSEKSLKTLIEIGETIEGDYTLVDTKDLTIKEE